MSRRKSGKAVSGVVLLDKPAGMSSNHALQKVRRLFEARKAGHTGSLDPFATGMLPICLGEASKTAAFMIDSDKTYRATAHLGSATETGDIEGAVVQELPVPELSETDIRNVFAEFTGEIEQVPPMYSALKHKGQPLYKLAREGKTVERKPRRCMIHELKLHALSQRKLEFELSCSKGTYVRTLAEDLAKALGTCAHLVALRRLWVEPFDPEQMVTVEQLAGDAETGKLEQWLLPVDAGLPHWPVVSLETSQLAGFRNGNPMNHPVKIAGLVRVHDPEGRPMGLAECTEDGVLRPKRVFNPDTGPKPVSTAVESGK
jgi:tRNA pseudouridine55 synthase